MSNNTRKIVVLSKIDSPRIEQAIFILRDEAEICEHDAVAEAQKIIDNYRHSLSETSEPRLKIKSSFILGMAIYTLTMVSLTAIISNILR